MKVTEYELFCPIGQDFLKCLLCDNSDDTLITCTRKTCGEILELESNHNRIFFLVEGEVTLEYEYTNNTFKTGTAILIPHLCDGKMQMMENTVMIIMNVQQRFNFCERFPLQKLHQWKKEFANNHHPAMYPLPINPAISGYLDNIITLFSAGIKCKYFYEIKQQELFYYFCVYYSINELFSFFSPLLNNDTEFTELVYQNYESAKTIADLASITHYSVSGFKKRFIKVFGMAPHFWILKEKTKKIYNEITCTQKPFKEIFMEYHFYSISHFNRFCKKTYGITPAKLRAQNNG